MILAGLDIETSGLNFEQDCLLEVAWVIKEHGQEKPMCMKSHYVSPPERFIGKDYISADIYELTKIKPEFCLMGTGTKDVYFSLADDLRKYKVQAFCAHNGTNFDRPFLEKQWPLQEQPFSQIPWLDTMTDVPYPKTIGHRNLTFLAAKHGFLNPFPHAALMDVMTMLRILDHYDLGEVRTRAASPWIILEACVSYEDREEAKKKLFTWEKVWGLPDQHFHKKWVKRVKECDIEDYAFPTRVLS